jgi:hypothetical protein
VQGPAVLYSGGHTAEVLECQFAAVGSEFDPGHGLPGNGGCTSGGELAQPRVLAVAPDESPYAPDPVWAWTNVPSNATVVGYVDGDLRLWQRPVAGMVQFPFVEGDSEVVTAYDASGTVVARVDWSRPPEPVVDDGELGLLEPEQSDALAKLTLDTFRACLVGAGATFSADQSVAKLPAVADDQLVFDECASITQTVVAARVVEYNPKFIPTNVPAEPQTGDTPAADPTETDKTGDTTPAGELTPETAVPAIKLTPQTAPPPVTVAAATTP